ncbi:MAG: hypothetical protein Q8O67_08520 [Deltaproteobacteria bacterium]|nr:hypothetical protein [Deltaproteobacteria bacterium]
MITEGDVAAAFVAAVVDEPVVEAVPRTLRWALHVWAAGCDEAPLWLIHDLGFVLLRGRSVRLAATRDRAQEAGDDDDGRLRAARLAFEDRVVAAWLQDPSILSAHVVLAGLPDATQELAIAHAVVAALTRGLPVGTFEPGNVGALRTLQQKLIGESHFVDDDDVAARATGITAVTAMLETAKTLLAGRRLLFDEDLWELAHLEDVPSEAARLALRTMHRTMSQIGPPSSTTLSKLARRSRDVPVDDDDTSSFPAGGFDAMSTQGTFENLVRSEVAYVGEGSSVDENGVRGPDLFDLRFVEGELLYYTRDESPLLEQRRALVFVVVDVERLRHKPVSLPTQTLVLVLACCLRAHQDLTEALGPLAVHTTFALAGHDAAVVDEERGLLATSLMADIAHRRVALLESIDGGAELPGILRGSVVFSPLSAPGSMKRDAVHKDRPARLWVRVGGGRWIVDDGLNLTAEVDAADPVALRAFVDRLLLLS